MVKSKKIGTQVLFICEICGLGYEDKETAQECEEWCGRTGTCNTEITKKAVYSPSVSQSFLEKLKK